MLRRSLAANTAVGSTNNLEAVIDRGLQSSLSHAMREHAWQLVHDWAAPEPARPRARPVASASGAIDRGSRRGAASRLSQIIEADAHGAIGLAVAAELGVHERIVPLAKHRRRRHSFSRAASSPVAALGAADESVVTQAIDAGLMSATRRRCDPRLANC